MSKDGVPWREGGGKRDEGAQRKGVWRKRRRRKRRRQQEMKEEREREGKREEGGERKGRTNKSERRKERGGICGKKKGLKEEGEGKDGCLQGQLSVAYRTSPGIDTRRRTLLITGGRLNPVHTLALYTCVCVCVYV